MTPPKKKSHDDEEAAWLAHIRDEAEYEAKFYRCEDE